MRQAEYPWKYLWMAVLLAATGCAAAHLRAPGSRTLEGSIIFTNNTPRNLATFPAELYTADRKRRIAAATAGARGDFTLTGVEPGRSLLKLTWAAEQCTLWYRVDLTQGSKEIEVLMDVDCAHPDGGVLDPYRVDPASDAGGSASGSRTAACLSLAPACRGRMAARA